MKISLLTIYNTYTTPLPFYLPATNPFPHETIYSHPSSSHNMPNPPSNTLNDNSPHPSLLEVSIDTTSPSYLHYLLLINLLHTYNNIFVVP